MRYSIALKCSIFWMKPPVFGQLFAGRKSSSQMARQYRVDNFRLKNYVGWQFRVAYQSLEYS